jgi:hypothetical protein
MASWYGALSAMKQAYSEGNSPKIGTLWRGKSTKNGTVFRIFGTVSIDYRRSIFFWITVWRCTWRLS